MTTDFVSFPTAVYVRTEALKNAKKNAAKVKADLREKDEELRAKSEEIKNALKAKASAVAVVG